MSLNFRNIVLIFCASAFAAAGSPKPEFFAYYTHLQSPETFERYSRTGDAADLVVNVGSQEGKLVFWRGTSYLPYWETPSGSFSLDEIVPRRGDGDQIRPDRVNAFSHVALVGKSSDRVVISWRYLAQFSAGNPYKNVSATNFVEEYFTVTKSGKLTRVVKRGTPNIDDWNDPLNQVTQILQLAPSGITQLSRTNPGRSVESKPVKGSRILKDFEVALVREWRFDEAAGDFAVETTTGFRARVPGSKTLWRAGVSGTSLQFDDYNTSVALPLANAPVLKGSLTLEAWCAVGAYPWNWCPLVQQGDDEGYFLGLDAHGHPAFKATIGKTWHELVATNCLDRFRWTYIAGAYDQAAGTMTLFIDGKPIISKLVGSEGVTTATAPIQIGKGKPRTPADPVGRTKTDASYSFDGLIDEVRIYDKALTPGQIGSNHALVAKNGLAKPTMDARALPKFNTQGRFGAHYTRLEYYDVWDNLWCFGPYPDVVVGFDQLPCKFIFWRGTGDIPMLANDNDQWYSNEFNETWNRSGGIGCMEPMSDKESWFNHVRVIENNPARVIVHWRFPLIDVQKTIANYHEDTGWGDWSDWYYYIYPDGMAVKTMHLWTDGPRNHEFQESMAIMGPNQHPEQILETDPALTLVDLDGKASSYSWKNGPPSKVDYVGKKIHIVNYRSECDAVTIGDFTAGNVYDGELTPYSVFPSWNHWPVSQIPSDGRYASFPDRAAHSSLTHLFMPDFRAGQGERPFQEKLLMEGMSKGGPKELAQLAKSWLQAPTIEVISDCQAAAYDPSQRAYVLQATGEQPQFRVNASADHPIMNLCCVVKNWDSNSKAGVRVSGEKKISSRQGIERDINGHPVLVLWLQGQSLSPVTVKLRRN